MVLRRLVGLGALALVVAVLGCQQPAPTGAPGPRRHVQSTEIPPDELVIAEDCEAPHYAIFAHSSTEPLRLSGSNNRLTGIVLSNHSFTLSGNRNDLEGYATAPGGVQVSGNNQVPVQPASGVTAYPYRVEARYFTPTFSWPGDIDLANAPEVWDAPGQLKPGVYKAGGTISIRGANVTGNVTLIADRIEISGARANLTPFESGVLMVAESSISLSGRGGSFLGLITSTTGAIGVTGHDMTFEGLMMASTVSLNGSNNNVKYRDLGFCPEAETPYMRLPKWCIRIKRPNYRGDEGDPAPFPTPTERPSGSSGEGDGGLPSMNPTDRPPTASDDPSSDPTPFESPSLVPDIGGSGSPPVEPTPTPFPTPSGEGGWEDPDYGDGTGGVTPSYPPGYLPDCGCIDPGPEAEYYLRDVEAPIGLPITTAVHEPELNCNVLYCYPITTDPWTATAEAPAQYQNGGYGQFTNSFGGNYKVKTIRLDNLSSTGFYNVHVELQDLDGSWHEVDYLSAPGPVVEYMKAFDIPVLAKGLRVRFDMHYKSWASAYGWQVYYQP